MNNALLLQSIIMEYDGQKWHRMKCACAPYHLNTNSKPCKLPSKLLMHATQPRCSQPICRLKAQTPMPKRLPRRAQTWLGQMVDSGNVAHVTS
eukprot:453634-Pelagomonas_calceolata.AAC.6